jgi:hypothetical protein
MVITRGKEENEGFLFATTCAPKEVSAQQQK